jgi:hypothetical protein
MAISTDMSFWLNTFIFNKLSEICPSLSLNGADRKIYEVCIRDFRNFVAYLGATHEKIEGESCLEMPQGQAISIILGSINGIVQSLELTKDVTEFVSVWVGMWWKKWQERTKIILSENDMPMQPPQVFFSDNVLKSEENDDLIKATVNKLIQCGEICCTEIIAEALLKKAIGERPRWTLQDKVNLISRLQREAKVISYTHGPLIFLRPDNYFKLREWRDDNANQIV